MTRTTIFIVALVTLVIVVMVVGPVRDALYESIFGGPTAIEAGSYYTCPMHPQLRLFSPGPCPICGMDLVKKKGSATETPESVTFTPQQIQQGGITSERIKRRNLVRIVDAAGRIDYDERSLASVAARIDGRVDRIFADFTGMEIHKGHEMVWIYSPQLISAQQEFFSAIENLAVIRKGEPSAETIAASARLVDSAKRRLLLWGIAEEQIALMEKDRRIVDHLTILAPIGGTIIKKNIIQGMYVKEGDVLYEIADLSTVWLYADVYEQDIPLILQPFASDFYQCPMHPEIRQSEPGNCTKCRMPLIRHSPALTAEITSQAFPGTTFQGAIEFAFPFVNPQTRTLRVRISIPNPDKKLRAEMFANARIRVERDNLLALPESAVTWSGRRNIVFVDKGQGTFAPRTVALGARYLYATGGVPSEEKALPFHTGMQRFHEVLDGVTDGEIVVTSGNFLVDAESNLQGALSKLAKEEREPQDPATAEVRKKVDPIVADILQAAVNLVRPLADGAPDVAGEVAALVKALERSRDLPPIPDTLNAETKKYFTDAAAGLQRALTDLPKAKDPDALRTAYADLSVTLRNYLIPLRGSLSGKTYHLFHCPMVHKDWIQQNEETANPYAPHMKECGSRSEWK